MQISKFLSFVVGALCLACSSVAISADGQKSLAPTPAVSSSIASSAQMISAAWAGDRVVAVGDHGIVLVSDDHGAHYRQADKVPVSSQLNAVSFVDAKLGWAVGQWGVVLATTDGGLSWQIQHIDTERDRPLFSVKFLDAMHGVAVGLWSLVLTTDDGGITWIEQKIAPPASASKADHNLFSLFSGEGQTLYATAERGQILVSKDVGKTWTYIDTGYKGSLWAGAMLPSGQMLVGGQHGSLMRGRPGSAWEGVPLKSTGSVTGISVSGLNVVVVGLEGQIALSHDGGMTFALSQLTDGSALTSALLAHEGQPILFSRRGPVSRK